MATYGRFSGRGTGETGFALADQEYFRKMHKLEDIRAGKTAGRKLGISAAKGLKTLYDYTGPAKLQADSMSIFEPQGGSWFEKIGKKLTGPDLSTVKLTPEAREAGYSILKEPGKVEPKTGAIAEWAKEHKVPFKATKTTPSTATLMKEGDTISKQVGPGASKLTSLMGAYQAAQGLSTVFDPNATGTRKVAGGVSTALGVNALLAMGGANIWNPAGPVALGLGLGAGIVDMFG